MLTLTAAGAWLLPRWLLLQQQLPATRSDTLLMRLVAEPRSWFDTVSGVASILIALALLGLCVGLIPAAWNFRNSYKKVNELLEKVYGDINPLMRHASTIADNVNYISTSLRVDVQQVNQTIATANERLQEAVRLTERRVQEFNALLHVVQREAEDTFVSTAAALRGVREGAATFREDALAGSRSLRRARIEDAMARAEALAFEEGGEEEEDALDSLGELDESSDDPDEFYAELADEMEEAARHAQLELANERALADDDAADDDTREDDLLESGELSDGYVRGGPPAGSGGRGDRPRIRSRRRGGGAPRRGDAPEREP